MSRLDADHSRPNGHRARLVLPISSMPDFCAQEGDCMASLVTSDQIQALPIARGRIREEDRHIFFEWLKGNERPNNEVEPILNPGRV